MRKIFFSSLLILIAVVISQTSFTQVRGPYARACNPIPTKDGIAVTPEVKVPPMTEARRQAHFIKVKGQNKSMAPTMCTDQIVDGGFETGGIPSTFWNPETSTNFGTPLCNAADCGTGGGAAAPRTGAIWAWFGGVAAPETATLGQTVTILPGTATLNFWMRIGTVSFPFTDVLNVRVDGTIVQTYTEPSVAEGAYTLRSINLNAYTNGAAHTILFEYVGTTTGISNFVIDDVTLDNCPVTTSSDLAITKTDGVSIYTSGSSTTYTITASNAGPNDVIGTTVTDNFPAAITSVAWTAMYAGGATGPTNGVGNISATVNIPSGGSATFTAVCIISAGATGTLANTATITVPGGVTDPNLGNNTATDSDAPIIAQIMGGSVYSTLQEAIDAALDGNTIIFLQNITETNLIFNKSVNLNAGAFTLTASGLTIPSGKYMRWLTNTLTIPTGSVLSNLGTLWNNGAIVHPNPYMNQGIYKGTGTFNGNFTNNGSLLPGN